MLLDGYVLLQFHLLLFIF